MDVLSGIVGFIIAAIVFAVKNWADIKAIKKGIAELSNTYIDIREDGKITNEEKDRLADKSLALIQSIIPVLANIWKFNWKKKHLKELG